MTMFDQFLVDASVRAAIILTGAACLSLVLRVCHSSSAARHWVWTVGLVGALAVPALMAIAPAVTVSVPWLQADLPPLAIETTAVEVKADEAMLAWVLPVELAAENVTPVEPLRPVSDETARARPASA